MYLDLYTKAVSERRPIELSSIVNHYEKINSEKLSNIDGFDLFNMVKRMVKQSLVLVILLVQIH